MLEVFIKSNQNWSTQIFYKENQSTNNEKQTNLWIPLSHLYIQLFAIIFGIIEIMKSPGTHQWWWHQQDFPFFIQQKGVDQGIGRRGLWLVSFVSFRGQIDGEAVTRMSGRHWMISLRNLIS